MHIKDSGTVLLTKDDYAEYLTGKASTRIQQVWNLSYEELNEIVKGGKYKIIEEDDGRQITTIKNVSGESTEGSTS